MTLERPMVFSEMAFSRRAPQKRKSRVAMFEDDDEEDLSVPVLKEEELKPNVVAQTVHSSLMGCMILPLLYSVIPGDHAHRQGDRSPLHETAHA